MKNFWMGKLFKNKLESLIVGTVFMVIYLLIDRTDFMVKTFPASFDPPKSAAQIIKGDLYGTCAPIEQLQELNYAISPILSQLK